MAEATSTLRQATNKVTIEGVLKENNLERAKDKDGKDVIRGNVVVQLAENEEIKVNFYSGKITSKGKENPSYRSLDTAMDNYNSIADCLKLNQSKEEAKQNATKVEIRGANFRINDYYNENKKEMSTYVEIAGSFLSTAKEKVYAPRADFELECFIQSIKPELDKEDAETGRVIVKAIVPVYGGKVFPITLIAGVEDDIADFINTNYAKNQTVFLLGEIHNTITITRKESGGGFGKKKVEEFENVKQEFMIVGGGVNGDPTPYEENPDMVEKAFALEDIKGAIAEREIMLETKKAGGSQKKKTTATKQAPGGLF